MTRPTKAQLSDALDAWELHLPMTADQREWVLAHLRKEQAQQAKVRLPSRTLADDCYAANVAALTARLKRGELTQEQFESQMWDLALRLILG